MRSVIALFPLIFACANEGAPPPESDAPFVEQRALRADGRTIVSRAVAGEEPGETELVLNEPGREPRVVFPAPGADDRPTWLPDGRVLFVSTRSTIASLWVGDLRDESLVQLTNLGLRAGAPRTNFTPPPHGELAVKTERDRIFVEYDGVRVEVKP